LRLLCSEHMDNAMNIEVSTLSGCTWKVASDTSWTGETLRLKCAALTGARPTSLVLAHKGILIEDAIRLATVDFSRSPRVQIVQVPTKHLLSVGDDKRLILWDIRKGVVLSEIRGSSRCLNCSAADPLLLRVLTAGYGIDVCLWDLQGGTVHKQLSGCVETVNCMKADWENDRVLLGCEDGRLLLWNFATPMDECSHRYICTEELGHCAVNAMSVDWSTSRVLVAGDDSVVKLLDFERSELLLSLRGHEDAVNAVVVDWESQCVLSGSDDGVIHLRSIQDGKLLLELLADPNEIRDANNGRVATGVHSLQMDLASGRAVSGHRDAVIRVWDLQLKLVVRELREHMASVLSLDVDWSAGKVFSGSRDSSIRIWDLETAEVVHVLRGHSSSVRSVVLWC